MRIAKIALIGALLLPAVGLATARADGEAPKPNDPYLVGISDRLRVVVWGEDELTLSVQVRPDGMITVPLANDIHVAGRSPDEIRTLLTEQLAPFLRDPNVTVIVEQFNSYRVFFLGEISGQGTVNFFQPTRLLQAIAQAGGLTEFSKKKITLVRETGGIEKRFEIDYKALLAGDKRQENLLLKPNDLLLFD